MSTSIKTADDILEYIEDRARSMIEHYFKHPKYCYLGLKAFKKLTRSFLRSTNFSNHHSDIGFGSLTITTAFGSLDLYPLPKSPDYFICVRSEKLSGYNQYIREYVDETFEKIVLLGEDIDEDYS